MPGEEGFENSEASPLLNLQLRAVGATDFERRLAEM
jgi:hypothetical protein